ncbi:MAG: hypothetical protein WCY21_06655 [Candidatus Cloacimonadaceae bacterium]|jgi:hypothetical protein|nr:hypothetical protein [Candidatus Cloacimonadota bacterium]MDX9949702.1 hypothetical protein [Candidatus Syntrophosphaera sp.]NLN85166.1 hypothetical protein [Candidatus Cloacimonadota bacterium]
MVDLLVSILIATIAYYEILSRKKIPFSAISLNIIGQAPFLQLFAKINVPLQTVATEKFQKNAHHHFWVSYVKILMNKEKPAQGRVDI